MDRLDRIDHNLRLLKWMLATEIVLQILTLILVWHVNP
jgi:hypothetical protein